MIARSMVIRGAGPLVDSQPIAFSFGTLVTSHSQYEDFKRSFEAVGFTTADCEYLIIDNSAGNAGDGYGGLNAILNAARGRHVILCHQDLLAIDDRATLERRLAELSEHDPHWAVAGNAGQGNCFSG
jgi:hypothetical protein